MTHPDPILVIGLMPKIDRKLVELLRGLTPEDWSRQTIAPKWKVKDVAVHLLDGNLRSLSMLRDQYFGESPGQIESYDDLVAFLNRLNADWVQAMQRLSPRVIIDLLKQTGKEYCAYLTSLDPFDRAVFSVAWAGESESQNWFHIAREYTEKWHHQQQIRLAVGQQKELLQEEWYLPYLDTSVRALPHHYRSVTGQQSDLIRFVFRGERDKSWFLMRKGTAWELLSSIEEPPTCQVIIPDSVAWRVFTKGIAREEAVSQSEITGDRNLGEKIFDMLAVMA